MNLENLVGQCYDSGSNMRGEYQGVAARVPSVRNTFGAVSSLYKLIESSAKRHQVFEHAQQEAGLKKLTIKELCETRWTCRLECLKVILLGFDEIITTL